MKKSKWVMRVNRHDWLHQPLSCEKFCDAEQECRTVLVAIVEPKPPRPSTRAKGKGKPRP